MLFHEKFRENKAIQNLKINRNQKFVHYIRKDLNKCRDYLQAISIYHSQQKLANQKKNFQSNYISDKRKAQINKKFKIPNYITDLISTSEVQINLSDSSDSSLTPIDETVSSFLDSASKLVEPGMFIISP